MDVFDLYAKIGLDKSEYEAGLKDAKGSMSTLAENVGNGLKTVAKVGTAAVTAAAAGVAALTKMGVEGYAQYEQLVGGVETLFKTSQNIVMGYAENAYKTAGMSANEYMETVTSFSASLIQSLGGDTEKAAEVGNMAITDMSDNANKMGTSMEMIQNAYNGFAKQNYTMLDNLKLGYGGTKEEMQRLIDDANKVKEANGEMADLSIDSFADVAEAIHIIQSEMGITGTTAREAATTIEGSLSMMKGAWQNLIVGMADENANMDVLINNFVESVATAAQNLLPRIEQTLIGIGQLITALAPVIADALPALIEAVLPSLLTAAVSLVTALVNGIITALPAVYDALLIGVQTILVEVFGVSEEKAGEFADGVNSFFVKIKDGFMALVESAQTEGTFLNGVWVFLQETAKAVGDALKLVWDGVSAAFTWCAEQINTDGTFLNGVWNGLQEAGEKLGSALAEIWDKIYAAVDWAVEQINTSGTWLNEIWVNLQNAGQSMSDFFSELWAALSAAFSWCVEEINGSGEWFKEIWEKIQDTVATISEYIAAYWEALSAAFSWCVEQINTEGTFLNKVFNGIKEYVSTVFDNIKTTISTAIDVIKGIFATFTAVLRGDWEGAFNAIKDTAESIWEGIKDCWSNASTWFNNTIIAPVSNFFKGMWDGLKAGANRAWNGIKSVFSSVSDWFKDVFSTAWQKVKDVFSTGGKVFDGIKEGIISAFKSVVNTIIDGINKVMKVPFDGLNDVLRTLKSVSILGVEPFKWVKTFSVPQIPKLSTGLNFVPYDEYPAFLHRGEAVLTAAQARAWRNGQGGTALTGGNGQITSLLLAILNAITGGNEEMIQAILADKLFVVGEREFARAVKTYA